MTPPFLRRPLVGLLALALIGLGPLAGATALAQADQTAPSYPVAIYQGACETPADEPSFLVGTTYPWGADPEEDDDDLELRGAGNVEPVATVEETFDTTFETLLDEQPHLIAVHDGEVGPETIVACGELGGIVDDGRLVVGIRPVGDAGVAGIAILDEDEAGFLGIGEDQVNVRVYLMEGLAAGAPGAPATPATPATTPEAAQVEATLLNQQEEEVGTATLEQTDGEVMISVAIEEGALEPGEHGIHIHETGVCDPGGEQPFGSAGGHFNPTGAPHGGPDDPADEAHAGDLGNLTAEENGSAQFQITTDRVSLEEGAEASLNDEDGSALVVHADPDDLETDPAGNSGERVLCGVLFPAAETTPAATPTPEGEAAAEEVTVEMVDIDFNPNEFTIPANTDVTVTLPNSGAIVHNFHIDELDVHSEDVQPGDETTVTINAEPGEYEYYCDIPGHREAGMVGTLIVEEQ